MCAQAVYTQPPDSEEDTFQIMVATDTHLGYKESNALLKNDSFEAFEEVLQLYKRKQGRQIQSRLHATRGGFL